MFVEATLKAKFAPLNVFVTRLEIKDVKIILLSDVSESQVCKKTENEENDLFSTEATLLSQQSINLLYRTRW
jgi:hypothetical protein